MTYSTFSIFSMGFTSRLSRSGLYMETWAPLHVLNLPKQPGFVVCLAGPIPGASAWKSRECSPTWEQDGARREQKRLGTG